MRSFSPVCLISLIFKTQLGQLFIFWLLKNVILFQETKLNCEISILSWWRWWRTCPLPLRALNWFVFYCQVFVLPPVCAPNDWTCMYIVARCAQEKSLFSWIVLPYRNSLIICVNQASHETRSCRDYQIMLAVCTAVTGSTQTVEEAGDTSG